MNLPPPPPPPPLLRPFIPPIYQPYPNLVVGALENPCNGLSIRGLSPAVPYDERNQIFYGLGATSVHNYPYYTVAYFTNETACHSVIRLLHQRQWIPSSGASKLTTRLRVEFLRSTDSESRIVNAHTVCDSSLKLTIRQNQARFSSPHVAKHNSLMSKYRFPPATLSVIQRISDTILSNSYFYHQVLLLMLQLGLHPPFDADNPPNDNLKVDNNSPLNDIALPKRKADDLLASDESELESGVDESTTVSKQPIYNPKRQRKVVKNLKTGFVGEKAPPKNKKTSANEIKPLTTTIEEVFESEQQPFKRNRSLEIKITTGLVAQPELEFISGTFGIIEPPDEAPEAAKKPLPSVSFDLATLTPSDLITDAILVAKTLPRTEWLHHKVFAGYRTNPICNRLYVKNLHKSTTLRDLYCLYGKFVNLNNSEHLNSFNILKLDRGRMHGQAFVTLPNETIAAEALAGTNGYIIHQDEEGKVKPIVVNFALSKK